MKKYKLVSDTVLILGLVVLSVLAMAPKSILMPSSIQMLILGIVLGLISMFLVLFWREKPTDEREAHNQAEASRFAYIVGSSVLIISLVIQSIEHTVDSAVPLALLAMIVTKLIVQNYKDNN
jgi:FtsH-binding integral membrane protein